MHTRRVTALMFHTRQLEQDIQGGHVQQMSQRHTSSAHIPAAERSTESTHVVFWPLPVGPLQPSSYAIEWPEIAREHHFTMHCFLIFRTLHCVTAQPRTVAHCQGRWRQRSRPDRMVCGQQRRPAYEGSAAKVRSSRRWAGKEVFI